MIGLRHLREESFRRRIGLVLLLWTLAVAFVLTLRPFRFDLATASFGRIDWHLYYRRPSGALAVNRDFVLNLVMLSPLGAGWALLRGSRGMGRIALEAALLGLATSITIETIQIFEPSRCPQLADVWRNTAGCLAAAATVAWLVRHVLGAVARAAGRGMLDRDSAMRVVVPHPVSRS
jgi:glycopeptide antibiotics resistance protein